MRRIVMVAFAIGIVAAGCAQQEDTTVATPPTAEATASAAASPAGSPTINDHGTKTFTAMSFELEVELDDFYFEPTFIKAPGDATAMVKLKNEGTVAHTFTSDTLNFDQQVEPGKTAELTVKLGTETRYEFYCKFHKDQGMSGAFQPH